MKLPVCCFSVLLIMLCAGCWPFEPRPAEQPDTSLTPKVALFPAEIPGIVSYVYNKRLFLIDRILTADFRFFTDPAEATGARQWGSETEIPITASIINEYTNILLEFFPTAAPDPVNPKNSAWIERKYVLTLSKPDTAGTGTITESFSGTVDLLTVQDAITSEWMIREWHDYDIAGDTLSSWGQLKLRYR